MKKTSTKKFIQFLILTILLVGSAVMCEKMENTEVYPPENKERIRTEQEDPRDSVPPGHHPENDDDDPYGGKYDPIWLH